MRKTTILSMLALAGVMAAPAEGALPAMDGAPTEAKVRFSSGFLIPPAGFSLLCRSSFGDCTTTGRIDLTTEAEVSVKAKPRAGATQGAGALSFSKADGAVSMTFKCEGASDPWLTEIESDRTQAGELEVARVAGEPGANALAISLNHAGVSGMRYPTETYDRSDGGCDAPVREQSPTMGQWYFHFLQAHRSEQESSGNDLALSGLKYADGVYAKTYNRLVSIDAGGNRYVVDEVTRVEVEPRYCRGAQNRIASAVADGESLGLDGARFYPGQVVTAPPKTKIVLGDSSKIELEKGGRFRIDECDEDETQVYLGETVSKFLARIKKIAGGSDERFEVQTGFAAVGVRGTVFSVAYDKRKRRTRVAVDKGSIALKGIRGAKGRVIVRAGQVGLQKGTRRPRLVKR